MNNMYINANSLKIFTGTSNPQLARDITTKLKQNINRISVLQFNDGEIQVEVNEPVRDDLVFVVQSTCAPVNDNIMELLIMVDAIKRSHAGRIVAIIPYYGYSRQDRRPGYSRTPITSKLVATMIETAGVDYVVVVDIHSQQQQGFFDIPVTNISASPEITASIWKKFSNLDDIVIVSPDIGGVGRARSIAKQLNNAELAIIDKRRPEAGVSEVMNIIGDVTDKHCIIIDDIIDTAGTLAKGAAALKAHGARTVTAYATHPVLSNNAYKTIDESDLDEVVISDTIPLAPINDYNYRLPLKITQFSIADIVAETINRIVQGKSISAIYAGDD